LHYSYRSSFCFDFTVHSTRTVHYLWGARLLVLWPYKAWTSLPERFHSIESTVSLKSSSKHFYSITLSSQQLVSTIVFYHACQSDVGHIFCNWRYINNLLTYLAYIQRIYVKLSLISSLTKLINLLFCDQILINCQNLIKELMKTDRLNC